MAIPAHTTSAGHVPAEQARPLAAVPRELVLVPATERPAAAIGVARGLTAERWTTLSPRDIGMLQRTAGNAATSLMIAGAGRPPVVQRAPEAEHLSASNPTYQRAWNMIQDYFVFQEALVGVLADARDTGFRQFAQATSAEFNQKADVGLMEIFELALTLIPMGGTLKVAFEALKVGEAFPAVARLGERLERVKEVAEAAEGATKGPKAGGELGEKREKAEEGEARFKFQSKTLDSLLDLKTDNTLGLVDMRRAIELSLDKHARDDVDLVSLVMEQLGPIPEKVKETYKPQVMQAAQYFEVDLYKRYYLGKGGQARPPRSKLAAIELTVWDYAGQWRGIPDKVIDRLKELDEGGLDFGGQSVGQHVFPEYFQGIAGKQQLEKKRREEEERQQNDLAGAALGFPGQSVGPPKVTSGG